MACLFCDPFSCLKIGNKIRARFYIHSSIRCFQRDTPTFYVIIFHVSISLFWVTLEGRTINILYLINDYAQPKVSSEKFLFLVYKPIINYGSCY